MAYSRKPSVTIYSNYCCLTYNSFNMLILSSFHLNTAKKMMTIYSFFLQILCPIFLEIRSANFTTRFRRRMVIFMKETHSYSEITFKSYENIMSEGMKIYLKQQTDYSRNYIKKCSRLVSS